MLGAESRDCGDLPGVSRNDDDVSEGALAERIDAVGFARGIVNADELRPDDAAQTLQERIRVSVPPCPPLQARAGCSDSAKRRIRVAPSRNCSIEVAYEMRR
jgi:hypothetical protein